MTKEEIAILGHAFFDGKKLQHRQIGLSHWANWNSNNCPQFDNTNHEWRIKPDEPKKRIFYCIQCPDSSLEWYEDITRVPECWGRIPELDREITLPEGE